jgi:plasmid replication initiation protein
MKESLIVSKSNALARSIQELDVTEAKIIDYCLSNIYFKEKVTAEDKYTIDVDDMATHFKMDRSQAYRELKRIALSIQGKSIKFPEFNNTNFTIVTSWVTSVGYEDATASLYIRFSVDIIPYISGESIRANFTSYALSEVANFKYIYSNRLYNICKSYAYANASFKFCTTVTELREFLSIGDTKYKLYADFKRVLQRSIDEINNKTSLNVEMLERKINGRTQGIVFLMSHKPTNGGTP